MTGHTILRVVSKLLLPYVLLFALYVQFHGDYGPGGGFQAGVIFAAGFVLYGLIYGLAAVRRVAKPRAIEILIAAGVLLYAGTGIATMLMGGNFLDYGAFTPAHPEKGQHYGILVIELGVGMTVAAVMIAVYSTFAGRGRA
ncbi:MAG: Na(+)/H(+) antiporter subunit B [Gemmatimonadetes bacterium]|nr:Na(+)/H(+) antiporter subunit B [Gemmatimonadota bacterium]